VNAPQPALLEFPFEGPPPPGEAREVVAGLWWIRMPLPFALDHINLWLLRGADGFTLVDCGYGDRATRTLWERHFAGTLAGEPVRRVVATHYHPDHVGNAAWLSARFACPVTMTLSEFLTAHAVHAMSPGYGFADIARLFAEHGMEPAHVQALSARGNAYAKGVPELPAAIDRTLDGEQLELGPSGWRVIEGFGHSPEHASLYAAECGILISGDMLLPRISTNVAVWASEPNGDPLGRFLASLGRFEALPPDTLVLPSHGLPFRGIHARVAQLRQHHDERLAEVLQAVREAGGDVCGAQVVPLLFRRELDLQQRFFAMGEAIAHLNHLWDTGALEREVDDDRRVRFVLPTDRRPD
jgi:glyoxylase-like metal-dependent hydrolase (beta-lactamase superfamily II)